jgi:hypothetical protein
VNLAASSYGGRVHTPAYDIRRSRPPSGWPQAADTGERRYMAEHVHALLERPFSLQ